ncbi:glycosyl transferase family group 2-domain-containing protein [Annulohypoxylon truncatum]|uniref:glycosyl transferase family group 2-domain-containing protein n=1 Tax=Annulohypoxylon truncatum TaxID=327061 RepID=UPI0020089887|nr:glycosyl transferase family group 2-domain-containing protein [Annulohypoxylon truncatum]KAI1207193.1 glycosyl transferase family group 2-domain-containing protein [Annulohypoxylon truncatum]
MGFLKSYFAPGRAKAEENQENKPATELNETGPNSPKSNVPSSIPGAVLDADVTIPRRPYLSRSESVSTHSIFPTGDFRNDKESMLHVKADVVCSWLYQQQLERQYATGMLPGEGVVLKKGKNNYTCCPPQLRDIPYGLYDMSMELNVRCAMTINTRVINVILASKRKTYDYIPLSDGLRLQVLPSMRELPGCQKHHFAAFIQDIQILVVWDDEPKKVLARADALEAQLMKMIWGHGEEEDEQEEERDEKVEKNQGVDVEVTGMDLEAAAPEPEQRKTKLSSPCIVGVTLALCICCMGLGLRSLAYEVETDGSYVRLALIAVIPVEMWVAMFFFQSLITNLFQTFGPISAVDKNSRFYSGKPPRRLNREIQSLPHVTIQMPVYKEGLRGVIIPTIQSLKQCISTYEMQGGSANIFVNDDGMQLIPEDEAQTRREFYDEHNIGWVSRPKHNPKPEDDSRPFLRRGKFKKASNMNYAMMVSNRVEDKLVQVPRTPHWSQAEEQVAYEQCLAEVLQEDEGRTWAEGNIRIGDYILIIDSDTRVPQDCLLDAVSEMEQSPQVAILQFSSGVMRVTTSFFEGGVTWFTNLIYSAITFVVANGDACPFVGHNAILRWSAIQDAASYQDEDGYEKFWSESHVSEDFDMALRLQCAGYDLRFASYTGEGFQEGVSLTVYDELARWEKYAYGCNELMFHPLRYWLTRGPITPLFRTFLSSNIHLPKKLTICTYIGTYYAIGACWILTLMNYFLSGWFFGLYDKFYIDSFAIYVSVIVVFTGFGNFALAILRYRLNQQGLIAAFWSNIKWVPLMTIFLGGLSLHVSQALLSHFFSIDMTWGATSKEYEEVNFLEEVPRLLRRFKGTFLWCVAMTALIVCGAFAFPIEWRIRHLASIWPLAWIVGCHFLLPVALNPALMVFAW